MQWCWNDGTPLLDYIVKQGRKMFNNKEFLCRIHKKKNQLVVCKGTSYQPSTNALDLGGANNTLWRLGLVFCFKRKKEKIPSCSQKLLKLFSPTLSVCHVRESTWNGGQNFFSNLYYLPEIIRHKFSNCPNLFLSVRSFPECPKVFGHKWFFSTFIRCPKLSGIMKIFKIFKIFSISIFPECPKRMFSTFIIFQGRKKF